MIKSGRIGACKRRLVKEKEHARFTRPFKSRRNILCPPMGNEPTWLSLSLSSLWSNGLGSRPIRDSDHHFPCADKSGQCSIPFRLAYYSANVYGLWSCHLVQCSDFGIIPSTASSTNIIATEGIGQWTDRQESPNSTQVFSPNTRCAR